MNIPTHSGTRDHVGSIIQFWAAAKYWWSRITYTKLSRVGLVNVLQARSSLTLLEQLRTQLLPLTSAASDFTCLW